ncbi:MAG: short-subunit dehydrogenase [Halioglobus sp.]|jgi:short-subunit dehydrogenase
MSGHKKTALVTGASAGLGAEFCRQLAKKCDVIIAVARRADRLDELKKELSGSAELHAIEADLSSIEGVTRTIESMRQQGPVDYLVNNAGFSTYGMFEDQLIDGQHDMVSLHINATMSLCSAAIPFMRELNGGHIINVSSLGAFLPSQGLTVYGATKAFLNYYSQSLQLELVDSGIAVQALCPGYTHTEFHSTTELSQFDTNDIPEDYWMDASSVVSISLAALGDGNVIVVPGRTNLKLAKKGAQGQYELL